MAAPDEERFKKLLADIRQKYSLPELRLILKSEELGTAPGWDQLAERLGASDTAFKAKAEDILKGLHGDLILAGTKDVQVFELPPGEAPLVAAAFQTIVPSSTNFGVAYPLSLSETALRPLPLDHELAGKVIHENGDVSLVYCAKRTSMSRIDTKRMK